jgi:PIN domain nuclease of toxin-antitoxin system
MVKLQWKNFLEYEIFVSILSFWEISLKLSIGKFNISGFEIKKAKEYMRDLDCSFLYLTEKETITFYDLPLYSNHKDPFDRMIIWQAITNKIPLISKDKLFDQYEDCGLKLVW